MRYIADANSNPDNLSTFDGFVIDFRDGKSIGFKVNGAADGETEMERNLWMDVIEESHYILTQNPLPAWLDYK